MNTVLICHQCLDVILLFSLPCMLNIMPLFSGHPEEHFLWMWKRAEQCVQLHGKCLCRVECALPRITILIFSCWGARMENKWESSPINSSWPPHNSMKQLKSRAQEAEREVKRLHDIIERSVEINGIVVDPLLHNDCVTDNHGREIGSNKAAVPERNT